jgi:hypothetical protein
MLVIAAAHRPGRLLAPHRHRGPNPWLARKGLTMTAVRIGASSTFTGQFSRAFRRLPQMRVGHGPDTYLHTTTCRTIPDRAGRSAGGSSRLRCGYRLISPFSGAALGLRDLFRVQWRLGPANAVKMRSNSARKANAISPRLTVIKKARRVANCAGKWPKLARKGAVRR